MEINVVILNLFLYIGTTLFFYYRSRRLNVNLLYWFFLSILAVFSYIGLVTHNYYDNIDLSAGYRFPLDAYILYYISNLIISWPLRSIKEYRIDVTTMLQNKFVDDIMSFTILFLIAFSILKIIEAVVVTSIGYDTIYENRHYGGERVIQYNNIFLKLFNSAGHRYYSIIQPFSVLYFFQRIIKKKGKVYQNVLALILVFVPSIAINLSKGSKGALFFNVASMSFYYVLFSKLINKTFKKYILFLGVSTIIVVGMFAYSVQESRQGGDKIRTEETSIRYLAEPMLNLGYYYWDKEKENPWGARLFPELFSTPNFETIQDRFDYWEARTGVPEAKFTTTWGDFYIEFGPVWGMLFLLLFIALWKYIILKKYYKFYMIPILHFYFFMICMMGMFDFCFYDAASHMMFIILLFTCLTVGYVFNKGKLV